MEGETTSMSGHSVYRERLRVTLKKTPTSKDDAKICEDNNKTFLTL